LREDEDGERGEGIGFLGFFGGSGLRGRERKRELGRGNEYNVPSTWLGFYFIFVYFFALFIKLFLNLFNTYKIK